MFTIEDVREIAIQIEHNGEAGYRRAGAMAKEPELIRMLNWMADQEHQHARWFEELLSVETTPSGDEPVIEMGKELLRNMVEKQSFSLNPNHLASEGNVQQLLRQFIEFEKDTILFYEMLNEFVNQPAVKRQLAVIIHEESNHIAKIKGYMTP